MANVLVIDDDIHICHLLSDLVNNLGHKAEFSLSLNDGYEKIAQGAPDVVFLDVRLPDGNGLKALPRIRKTNASPEVIIITGEGDPDGAELAVKNGAWDYLQKPLSLKKLWLPLRRVLQYRDDLKNRQKQPLQLNLDGIVGRSPLIKSCLEAVAQVAHSKTNVLITGETGTGKELFARAVHNNSECAGKNFVVVDCASLPEQLVESSLFGHQKGAFTGAAESREGLVKQADGGTLFLDEVGELSMPLQKAFLRVLQERRFRPVGGKKEVTSNFRLVAATNRNIDKMVTQKQFREDLLYRLQGVSLELPPLRRRIEDIHELVLHQMAKICRNYGTGTKGIAPEFFDALCSYDWPGNVRELINTLEGAITEAQHEPTLLTKHLPIYIRVHVVRATMEKSPQDHPGEKIGPISAPIRIPPNYKEFRDSVLAEAEKKYFKNLIAFTQGSIKKACQISGLGRTRIYTLMKKHHISRSGWAAPEIPY